ncbi:CZB domain-containing protein [Marinicellulosiphila megalodicopiae]|uniref:CZB domain-containing protein n=1 Tax=Marinicellulosiphila megalodicopiae TaxID=2724896 RepID=UPI003BAF0B49
MDHIVWKNTIYQKFTSRNYEKIENIANHHQCRLGKWFYEGEGRAFEHLKSYSQLEGYHKNVHDNGVQALELIKNDELTQSLEKLKLMESASEKVMSVLSQLSHEITDELAKNDDMEAKLGNKEDELF